MLELHLPCPAPAWKNKKINFYLFRIAKLNLDLFSAVNYRLNMKVWKTYNSHTKHWRWETNTSVSVSGSVQFCTKTGKHSSVPLYMLRCHHQMSVPVGGGAVPWLMFVGLCIVRSNASWVMITFGNPLPPWTDRLTNGQTRMKTLHSRNSIWAGLQCHWAPHVTSRKGGGGRCQYRLGVSSNEQV